MTPEEIKALRKALGEWTQEDLARELGLTTSAVARWEQGNRKPSGTALRLLQQLARRAQRAEGKEEAA